MILKIRHRSLCLLYFLFTARRKCIEIWLFVICISKILLAYIEIWLFDGRCKHCFRYGSRFLQRRLSNCLTFNMQINLFGSLLWLAFRKWGFFSKQILIFQITTHRCKSTCLPRVHGFKVLVPGSQLRVPAVVLYFLKYDRIFKQLVMLSVLLLITITSDNYK